MNDIDRAKSEALKAAKIACGDSIDAQFHAKRMLDRFELVMREHGFEYGPVRRRKPFVAANPPDESVNEEPIPQAIATKA
jgi:hypothetical protein